MFFVIHLAFLSSTGWKRYSTAFDSISAAIEARMVHPDDLVVVDENKEILVSVLGQIT